MLEFVDSDLYFVLDKNNFINPLLQVGSADPDSLKKLPDLDPTGQKSPDPHPWKNEKVYLETRGTQLVNSQVIST